MMRLDYLLTTLTSAASPVRIPDPAIQMQRELSTYWMPLCEPIHEWTTFAQHTQQRVPALTAIGHAFFALSYETKALRYFTLACQQHGCIPTDRGYWYTQAGRTLQDATH